MKVEDEEEYYEKIQTMEDLQFGIKNMINE